MSNDTARIDGELYDRRQVYDWLASHDFPADCIPLDGVRNLDRESETVEVSFVAHDQQGEPIIDRVSNVHMRTGWMAGRYRLDPPDPLKVDATA